MPMTPMADPHDLAAAERFLAAEARIAATFGRVEEAVAPLLRAMRARDRTTYVVDAGRGALLGHAFLRPPYAPGAPAEWFVAWGLRFPDGGTGWDDADPPLPRGVHAVVALGAEGGQGPRPLPAAIAALPRGWSVLDGEAAFLAAALPLHEWPGEPGAMADAMAEWTLARLHELMEALPGLATA